MKLTRHLLFLGRLILEGLMGFAGKVLGFELLIFLKVFSLLLNHYYNVIVPELVIFLWEETIERNLK